MPGCHRMSLTRCVRSRRPSSSRRRRRPVGGLSCLPETPGRCWPASFDSGTGARRGRSTIRGPRLCCRQLFEASNDIALTPNLRLALQDSTLRLVKPFNQFDSFHDQCNGVFGKNGLCRMSLKTEPWTRILQRQHLNPPSFHGNGGGSRSTNQDTKKGPSVAEPCDDELFRRLRRLATDHVAGRSHAEDAGGCSCLHPRHCRSGEQAKPHWQGAAQVLLQAGEHG